MRWSELVDVRSGLIGGGILACIVWFINAPHGVLGASTAALKQFFYTFLMGAFFVRLCSRLALRKTATAWALTLATGIPSLVTVAATWLVHNLRGTPEPLLSTLPAALLSPPAFAVWSWRVRRAGRVPWDRPPPGERAG